MFVANCTLNFFFNIFVANCTLNISIPFCFFVTTIRVLTQYQPVTSFNDCYGLRCNEFILFVAICPFFFLRYHCPSTYRNLSQYLFCCLFHSLLLYIMIDRNCSYFISFWIIWYSFIFVAKCILNCLICYVFLIPYVCSELCT